MDFLQNSDFADLCDVDYPDFSFLSQEEFNPNIFDNLDFESLCQTAEDDLSDEDKIISFADFDFDLSFEKPISTTDSTFDDRLFYEEFLKDDEALSFNDNDGEKINDVIENVFVFDECSNKRKSPIHVDEFEENLTKKHQIQIGGNPPLYTIQKSSEGFSEKFKAATSRYVIRLRDITTLTFAEANEQISEMFSSMIEEFVKPAGPHDLVMVSICHSAFSNPIVLPLMKRGELSINMLITAFESVTQSYKHPVVEDEVDSQLFSEFVKIIKLPTGGSRRPAPL
jgi:hypothetical protein